MAVRSLSGTNQSISFGSDASIDDFAIRSFSGYFYFPALVNNGAMAQKSSNIAQGWELILDASGSTAAVQVLEGYNGTLGNFVMATRSLNTGTRYFIGFSYDSSAAGNVPIIYVDGTTPTLTINTNSAGSRGSDAAGTFITGEDLAGLSLADSQQDEAYITYTNANWTAAQMNQARWWGKPFGSVAVHHPFITDSLTNRGTATADATVTGATLVSTWCPPVQRPGMGTAL